jgi:hypothetical protein
MAFTQVTVTCRFASADGTIPKGLVSFTPTAPMSNGGSTVPAEAKPVTLVDGLGIIVLDANDDAGTVPSGTGYKVTERIIGAAPRTYTVILTHAQPAVNLADLVPTTTTPNYAYVVIDGTGHVPASQIPDLSATYEPVVNVRAKGIKCDGTDETTALNAMLAGGGHFFFPAGTYKFTSLTPASNTVIQGIPGATILAPIGNNTTQNARVQINSVSNVVIRDLTIGETGVVGRIGNYGPISGNGSTDIRIENVEVNASSGTGMHFINCRKVTVDGCWVHGTMADGIHFQRGSSDCSVSNCLVENTGDDSIGFVSHGYTIYGYCKNITITNNTLGRHTAGAPGSGVALIGIIGATVSNNIIVDSALSAVRVTAFFSGTEGDAVGGNIVIADNLIMNSGIYSGGGGGVVTDGISIYNQRNVKVSGNVIDKTVAAGIAVAQAGINIDVHDNILSRIGTRGIWLAPSSQSGDYLNLWTDANFTDGTSLSYVFQHQIAIRGNRLRVIGVDGIYCLGLSSQYIDGLRITDNSVHGANSTNAGSINGILANFVDRPVISGNNVADGYSGNALTKYATSNNTNAILTQNLPAAVSNNTYIGTAAHTSAGALPTSGSWNLGDVVWNFNPQNLATMCWICRTAGTLGTLNGGSTTGSITSGTTTLVVNSATGLQNGGYITIAGVTGIKQIVSVAGTTVTIDSTASATVSGAAVAYSPAAFTTGPSLGTPPQTVPLAAKTTTYTITSSDSVILASGGSFTVTLPSATTAGAGRIYYVKNTGVGTITLASGGGTIDAATTVPLNPGDAYTVVSDATNWQVL